MHRQEPLEVVGGILPHPVFIGNPSVEVPGAASREKFPRFSERYTEIGTCKLGDGIGKVPVFEVSFFDPENPGTHPGLENAETVTPILGRAALLGDVVCVGNRMLQRALGAESLHRNGRDKFFKRARWKLAHPARMVRDADRRIKRAEFLSLPIAMWPHAHFKPDVSRHRPDLSAGEFKLRNLLPSDAVLDVYGDPSDPLQREDRYADVVYNYFPYGQTTEGITVMSSAPSAVHNLPRLEDLDENTLLLVHPEVLIETVRVGSRLEDDNIDLSELSVEDINNLPTVYDRELLKLAGRMVFPCNAPRDAAGQLHYGDKNQGISLGVLSDQSLQLILKLGI